MDNRTVLCGIVGVDPIDQFIEATLRSEGLSPSAEALPRESLRRVSFDLTGLPPSTEQLETFDVA